MAGVGTILTVASTAMAAASTLAESGAQQNKHEFQKLQYEKQAQEVRAIGSQKIAARKREMDLLTSNQMARAAASGGASDASVENMFGNTAADGAMNMATEYANAENKAQTYDYAAKAEALSAKSAKKAGTLKLVTSALSGATSVLSGATSLYGKFGAKSSMNTQRSNHLYG